MLLNLICPTKFITRGVCISFALELPRLVHVAGQNHQFMTRIAQIYLQVGAKVSVSDKNCPERFKEMGRAMHFEPKNLFKELDNSQFIHYFLNQKLISSTDTGTRNEFLILLNIKFLQVSKYLVL